jgi:hypothetical protein
VKRLLLALLLSTSAAAHAQSLSKALVVPTCAQGRELEQVGPGLQQLTMDTQGRLCAAATNAGGTNMVTPLMVNTAAVAATVQGQNPFGSNWNAAALRGSPSPIPGTVSNLTVHTLAQIVTGYYTFSFYVGGATTVQCSIGQGGPNLGTNQQCSDTVDTADVYAGNIIAFQSQPTGTPTATGNIGLSALFTSANGQESLIGSSTNNFISQTGITYLGPSGFAAVTTDQLAAAVMPTDGVLDHLYVSVPYALLTTASIQFTVFKNGVATSITTTCSAPNNTPPQQCTDLTHSLSVAPKDTISLQICPSNAAGCAAGAGVGNVTIAFSLRWQPAVLHQAVLFSNPNSNSATTNYLAVAGVQNGTVSTNETLVQNISPGTMTLGNLLAAQCPAISATVSRNVTLRSNSVSRAPTVTLPAGSTVCPTLDIEQDTTDTYQTSASELLSILTTVTGGGINPLFRASMTATVP